MAKKFINIDFPFKNSPDGYFVNLNSNDKQAVKADLLHLLLTRKGQRLYNPKFGTDLLNYIFEPADDISFGDIEAEIKAQVKKYLPRLQLNIIKVDQSEHSEFAAVVRIDYTITDDVFSVDDFIIINI